MTVVFSVLGASGYFCRLLFLHRHIAIMDSRFSQGSFPSRVNKSDNLPFIFHKFTKKLREQFLLQGSFTNIITVKSEKKVCLFFSW